MQHGEQEPKRVRIPLQVEQQVEVDVPATAEEKPELAEVRSKLFEAMELVFSDDDVELERGLELIEHTPIVMKGRVLRVKDFIGKGAFGYVFSVEDDAEPGKRYALKLSKPFDRDAQYLANAETDTEFEQRAAADHARGMLREVAALKKMTTSTDHSPYPQFIDAQFIPNPADHKQRVLAVLMEQIEGENMQSILPEHGLEDSPDVLFDLAKQLAEGVQLTHQAGFMHRDIKPENAMIDVNDKVRLLDLGLVGFKNPGDSERVVYKQSLNSIDRGTTEYMPVDDTEPASMERDIYALGITFQQLLVGSDFQKAMRTRARVNQLSDSWLKRYAGLSYRMIQGDALARPTIEVVVRELDAIQSDYQQQKVRQQIAMGE